MMVCSCSQSNRMDSRCESSNVRVVQQRLLHGKIGSERHSKRGANMLIHLHNQATATQKVRAAIQASTEPASALAERFGMTEQTIYK